MLQKIYKFISRHAGKALLPGLAVVAGYNWKLWQRDRELIATMQEETKYKPTLAHVPKVSAIVAAWNEHDHIDAFLCSFLALSYLDIELIICAGGTDDTLERARQYQSDCITVIEQIPGEGKQHALARCMEYVTGEIIYLTDADCRFSDEALNYLLEALLEDDTAIATGTIRPLDEQQDKLLPLYRWATDVAATLYRDTDSSGLLGQNAAIKRYAIESIGGMDFPAPTGTDYQLSRRLIDGGFTIRFVPSSVVPAHYAQTLREYRSRQSRWLRNLILYGWKYGAQEDLFVTIQTMSIGTVMLFTPLTSIVFGRAVLIPWAMLVAHAASSKLRYTQCLALVHQRSLPPKLFASLVPLTLVDFAIWALPILDLLNTKRRKQW